MKEVVDRPGFLTPALPIGLRAVQVTSDADHFLAKKDNMVDEWQNRIAERQRTSIV